MAFRLLNPTTELQRCTNRGSHTTIELRTTQAVREAAARAYAEAHAALGGDPAYERALAIWRCGRGQRLRERAQAVGAGQRG